MKKTRIISLFLTILLAVSVMIPAAAAEDTQESADQITFTLNLCETETAEDGSLSHKFCVDLTYNDAGLNVEEVFDSLNIEAAYCGTSDSITDWEWVKCRMSCASCEKGEDDVIINHPFGSARFLTVTTEPGKDFTVNITAPFDWAASFETNCFTTLTDPEAAENVEELQKIPVAIVRSGDLDGNGRVTANDSLKMMRYAIKLETLTDEQIAAADVNKDGKVDAKDSLAVLRYTVGYRDKGTVFCD